jgi:hypothetical protein
MISEVNIYNYLIVIAISGNKEDCSLAYKLKINFYVFFINKILLAFLELLKIL